METAAVFPPFRRHLEHFRSKWGLVPIVLHVSAHDDDWFTPSRKQSALAFLADLAASSVAPDAANFTKEDEEREAKSSPLAVKSVGAGRVALHLVKVRRPTRGELAHGEHQWQMAYLWKETPPSRYSIMTQVGNRYISYEVTDAALHAFVEPCTTETASREPRFAHFVNYRRERTLSEVWAPAADPLADQSGDKGKGKEKMRRPETIEIL